MFSSSSISRHINNSKKPWLTYRNVWSSVLYNHAHTQSMCRKELFRFSLIQNWLNENAEKAQGAIHEALLKSDHNQNFCKAFVEDVDWSKSPKALLYGSCVQGTAQKGGDADFALCFPKKLNNTTSSLPSVNDDNKNNNNNNNNNNDTCTTNDHDLHRQNHPSGAELIEPPRLIQRTIILPTLFKQLGETFPPTEGLITEPQTLHVDRVYHARVPILHFVPKSAIFPLHNNGNNNNNQTPSENLVLPRFDVAACTSGCRNSFVLRYYFAQSVTLRVMFLALKRWAKQRAYVIHSKRSSLNSYSLAIMLVYWAQNRGIVKTLEQEDPCWSSVESSPLANAMKSYLPIDHDFDIITKAIDDDGNVGVNGNANHIIDVEDGASLLQRNIDYDMALSDDECLAGRLFDFFEFYGEEFDRDTDVVDIRGSADPDKVVNRSEWKEKVSQQFVSRDLRVFGLDTDDQGKPILGRNKSNTTTTTMSDAAPQVASTMMMTAGSPVAHQQHEEFDIVSRHLYGHDVIAVRDPVEPHSVTRNLDFFMCEALWEEFNLARKVCEPGELLGLRI